ncbi:MAG: hypothetical protein JJT82_10495 [Legionellaceae bacterium]|nr:hypothetical protein [Legionellaceae bacterium]
MFEKAFIHDGYASRKGRDARMGIARAAQFIRKCSLDYQKDCCVLKLDIMIFFIRINRRILWERLCLLLEKHYNQSDKQLILEVARNSLKMNRPATALSREGNAAGRIFLKTRVFFMRNPAADCQLAISQARCLLIFI